MVSVAQASTEVNRPSEVCTSGWRAQATSNSGAEPMSRRAVLLERFIEALHRLAWGRQDYPMRPRGSSPGPARLAGSRARAYTSAARRNLQDHQWRPGAGSGPAASFSRSTESLHGGFFRLRESGSRGAHRGAPAPDPAALDKGPHRALFRFSRPAPPAMDHST